MVTDVQRLDAIEECPHKGSFTVGRFTSREAGAVNVSSPCYAPFKACCQPSPLVWWEARASRANIPVPIKRMSQLIKAQCN